MRGRFCCIIDYMDMIFVKQGEYEKGDAAFPVIRECVRRYWRAVSDEVEDEDSSIEICRTEKGRPYLIFENGSSCRPQCDISITHSGDIWMCMVSGSRCGIDFQYMRNANIPSITDRFFNEGEREYIEGGGTGQFTGSFLRTEEGRDGRFFDIWVRRESLGKYQGDGFFGKYPDSAPGGIPAQSLRFSNDDSGMVFIHEINASMLAKAGVHVIKDFRSACVSGSGDEPKIERI